jgi:hypothetical protein
MLADGEEGGVLGSGVLAPTRSMGVFPSKTVVEICPGKEYEPLKKYLVVMFMRDIELSWLIGPAGAALVEVVTML